MAKASRAKRKPTREQSRAWLATVLSPMLRALDVELSFVLKDNWSFRCESQDFEYLWPTAMMVGFPHRANADQVFRYHAALQKNASSHDDALAALRSRCQEAYKALIGSALLHALPLPPGAGPDDRKYFAEYVINGVRDLPSYYSFSEFWKHTGIDYLDLRSHPSLRSTFDSLNATGRSFKAEVASLHELVKLLQQRIADDAGLPPVPVPGSDAL